jgi:hypothetical protein
MKRPTLLPHLYPLRRGRTTLQLGVDPARAIVVEFADPATARLVELLDGRRTHAQVLAVAAEHGVPEESARQVLDTLRAAGVVVCAQTLVPSGLPGTVHRRLRSEAAGLALTRNQANRSPAQCLLRRSTARVLIAGYRGLGLPIAGALAGAGVGHVALDVGSGPGDDAGILVIRMAAPDTETRQLRAADATFIVYADPRLALTGPAQRGQPHLAIEVRDTAVVIGPLVPAAGSPCVRCLDLHRSDRDPAWPTLAVQLASLHADPVCPTTTLLAGAAYAAHEVLSHLDGRAATTEGATVEVSGPGQARRRSWPAHPGCTCRHRPTRSS